MINGKLSKKDIQEIIKLFRKGYGQKELSRKYHVDHSTIHYHLKKNNVRKPCNIPKRKIKKIRLVEVEGVYSIIRTRKKKRYSDYLKDNINVLESRLQSTEENSSRIALRGEIAYKSNILNKKRRDC